MILRGALKPGERLLEVELAARLAISRTPIRQALPALALEGLIAPVGGRGYAVRAFTQSESLAALHLRAMLEGFAARMIILRGSGPEIADELASLLREGDALLGDGKGPLVIEEGYGTFNERFHTIVIAGANDLLLSDLVARCNIVPFVSPRAVAFERHDDAEIIGLLRFAHRQHHAIVDALRSNDALRAEMLFREHATTQESSMFPSKAIVGVGP